MSKQNPVQIDFVEIRRKAENRVQTCRAAHELTMESIKRFEALGLTANAQKARVQLRRQAMALALAEAELAELRNAKL